MTKQEKLITALTNAAKKTPNKTKLKAKIKAIKDRKRNFDWLAR